MSRTVVFSPEARDDLFALFDYIADAASPAVATGYTGRLVEACRALRTFPVRGTARDDIRAGLRTIGFQRRVVIAFHLASETVVIDRLLYGGRDLGALR